MLRYLSRFGLLTLAFALATAGLLGWQADGFRWPAMATGESLLRPEPLYLLILGVAIVPPTLWDIFQLETQRSSTTQPPIVGTSVPASGPEPSPGDQRADTAGTHHGDA